MTRAALALAGLLALAAGGTARAAPAAQRTAHDAIYPPQRIPLAFDHAVHLEKARADCDDCHDMVHKSVRVGDRNLPPESACLGCHDVLADEPEKASPPAACSTCHPGYAPTFPPGVSRDETARARPHPAPVEMPPAALRFGHQPHLARGIPCERCHRGIREAGLGTRAHLPMMDDCTGCHDGRQAPDRCSTCHLAGPDGRLQTALPAGKLLPRGLFRDDDHLGDVVRTHGPAAKADADYCKSCHTERECGRCHAGTVKPVSIHPADYILTHPPQARRDDPACGTCHRLQSFCVDCHLRSGLTDTPGPLFFNATGHGSGRFHPEGWTDVLGGVPGPDHHKFEARRNLRVCVGCHQEDTCTRCHSVDATRALRASPHPPGFRRHCGRTRALNERGCLKCHGSREALDTMCGN